MIILGSPRGRARDLARYLSNCETNSNVSVVENRGTVSEDIKGALLEMAAYAQGSLTGSTVEKPLYHASISPETPYILSEAQREEACDALEAKLELDGHARIVIEHEKKGRHHYHVVWARMDEETRLVPDHGLYRIKQVEVARDLEGRFGHARVLLPHQQLDRDREAYFPSRGEIWQQESTGIKIKDVRDNVSFLYQQNHDVGTFREALLENGYRLAKGDLAPYVLLDQKGGVHSLKNRLAGIGRDEWHELKARLDEENLPTVRGGRAEIEGQKFYQHYGISEKVAAFLEASYAGGDDYVQQSTAALYDHQIRQDRLNAEAHNAAPDKTKEKVDRDSEMTDARQTKQNQLLEHGDARSTLEALLQSPTLSQERGGRKRALD